MIYNIGDKGSAYTEHTQTIWNGAVGQIRLVAKNKIRWSDEYDGSYGTCDKK